MIFVLQLPFVLLEILGMTILKKPLFIASTLLLLSACGGGSDGCSPSDGRPLDTTTDTTASCAQTRGANSVVIAYPVTNAIEQLPGAGAAFYSLKGSAIVTDQNGNAVADDTVVQLDVFDTLIARGIISGADTITGSLITDANPLQGDRTTAALDLSTVSVERNLDTFRTIKAGDIVLLKNASNSDQIRYVVSTTANSITVNTPYVNSYPSAIYPAAEYLVGQALVGTSILGIDENGIKTAGVSLTIGGLANFRLEYPGDSAHLGYGSVDYQVLPGITDPRTQYAPDGSTEVWVVANAGGSVVSSDQRTLSGIASRQISANPATVTVAAAGNVTVTLTVTDASDVRYPLRSVSSTSSTPAAATVVGCAALTGAAGTCTATVTGVATGTSTVTFTSGDGTVDVAVTVP